MDRTVCVDAAVIGTPKHLIVGPSGFAWGSRVPGDAWHLSGQTKDRSDTCLDTVLRLGRRSVNLDPPAPYVRMMQQVMDTSDERPPWARVMPPAAHRAFVEKLLAELEVVMVSLPWEYYRTVWVPGNQLLASLRPCAVDEGARQRALARGEGNLPALRSFRSARQDGTVGPPTYDRFKTCTGRLTVARGPQILTLRRDHRPAILRSVHGHRGRIASLDFSALEARVLLYERGRKCDAADLYAEIAADLGCDRPAAKAAIISELYGSSRAALGQRLGIEGKQLDDFVSRVRDYFDTASLLARVKERFLAQGHIVNRYGRSIEVDDPIDRIFISYYGQSTGVDVTFLGFRNIVAELASSAPKTHPIFLLHDALLLDVHEDDFAVVDGVRAARVEGYVQPFPLKLEWFEQPSHDA